MGKRTNKTKRGACPADAAAKMRANGWKTRGGWWYHPESRFVNFRWFQVVQWFNCEPLERRPRPDEKPAKAHHPV